MTHHYNNLPPELRAIMKFIEKIKNSNFGKDQFGPLLIILGILFIIASFSAFYTIDPDESGLVLRFGKLVEKSSPGLHFKLPFGIDQVIKVQTTTIRKEEFGFRTTKAGISSTYNRGRKYLAESLMLTGDLNVADVEWIIQYRVNDPYKFIFNIRNPHANLRDISESVMRLVVGDRSVDDILTVGRVAISDEVKVKMQEIYNLYGMGITITNVILQDVNPPEEVKDSFNDVNRAKQEQEKMVNEAWEEYNKTVPEERGKAEQAISVSEGYASEKVNRALGEAQRFISIHNEYSKAPEITKLRIYLEKMQDVLANANSTYIMDPSAKTLLPHLDVQRTKKSDGGAK